MRAKSLQSCPTLCEPMDYSPPGSSVPGILQERILEWVAIPFPRGSSGPRDQTWVSCVCCIAGRFFTAEPPGKPIWYIVVCISWSQLPNLSLLQSLQKLLKLHLINFLRGGGLCHRTCRILAPQPGIKPGPQQWKSSSLNCHGIPNFFFF